MKTLYLLRHAKSSWSEPGQPDFDRPLAPRGRRAAAAMGRYLHQTRIAPAMILCSSAARARDTLARAQETWSDGAPVRFRKSLYLADAPALLAAVRALDDRHPSVMLIGHEPGFSRLTLALAGSPNAGAAEDEARRRIVEKFPAGALAVLSFAVESWDRVAPGTGRLESFVRPRDLAG